MAVTATIITILSVVMIANLWGQPVVPPRQDFTKAFGNGWQPRTSTTERRSSLELVNAFGDDAQSANLKVVQELYTMILLS